MFSTSIVNIKKALSKRDKRLTDPCIKLLEYYHKFLDMFSLEKAKKLPPLRKAGVNHWIKLKKKDSKTLEVP